MAERPALTISIPTYNRPEHIRRSVEVLLPQLDRRCELLILDNCSLVPVADILRSLLDGHPNAERVTIHRNVENVGCVANIMKGMEMPRASWVWTFGDDDHIEPDAVERLLARIYDAPTGVVAIHLVSVFSPEGDLTVPAHTMSLERYLQRPSGLVEMSFLGQFVLQRDALAGALKYGYHFAYSCFPHVAVLAMALDGDGCILMAPDRLHDLPSRESGRTDHYRSLPLVLGTPTLAELPLGRARGAFLAQLKSYSVRALHSVLFDCMIRMGRPELRAEARLVYRQCVARLDALGVSPRDRALLAVGAILQKSPTAAHQIARTLRARLRKDGDEERFMRPIHAGLL